jgi:uncharacterized coiled-coil protein SlyX
MLMLVVSLMFLPACGPEDEAEIVPPGAQETEIEVEQEVEAVDPRFGTLEGYTFEQRAEFENEIGLLAQEYDARLAELEAKAAQMDEATRAELDQQITSLRQQRDALQQQLDQMAAASAEEWENLKLGLMAAIESFDQSVEEAESRVS